MAEEKWILDSVRLPPEGNVIFRDSKGNHHRDVLFSFKCPYCSFIYKDLWESKIRFRKCRMCNKPVKPYGKKLPNVIFLPDDKNDITIEELQEIAKNDKRKGICSNK